MEDMKLILASNLIRLRSAAGMTQAELGQRLNYSDKTVSKWERGESMPDISVLKAVSELYGVTLDELVSDHDQWKAPEEEPPAYVREFNTGLVIFVVLAGVWLAAALVFVIRWIQGSPGWIAFPAALPLSLAIHLVLNSVWNCGRRNLVLAEALGGSVYLLLGILLWSRHPWQLLLLVPLTAGLIWLGFRIPRAK